MNFKHIIIFFSSQRRIHTWGNIFFNANILYWQDNNFCIALFLLFIFSVATKENDPSLCVSDGLSGFKTMFHSSTLLLMAHSSSFFQREVWRINKEVKCPIISNQGWDRKLFYYIPVPIFVSLKTFLYCPLIPVVLFFISLRSKRIAIARLVGHPFLAS